MTENNWPVLVYAEYFVTCHTPGCIGENERLRIDAEAGGSPDVICGGCNESITDLVEITQ